MWYYLIAGLSSLFFHHPLGKSQQTGTGGSHLSSQAPCKAEIRKVGFQACQAKKVARLHFNGKRVGVAVHACHPSYAGRLKIGGLCLGQSGQKVRSYLQNNQNKKGWRLSSSGEHLLSKFKALSSKPWYHTHKSTDKAQQPQTLGCPRCEVECQ
jgi:hypothetical protein